MEPSVSPLPLPLWPMLALSLTLFCLTATAVTISAHYTKQLYFNRAQNSPEIAGPVSGGQLLRARRADTADSRPLF